MDPFLHTLISLLLALAGMVSQGAAVAIGAPSRHRPTADVAQTTSLQLPTDLTPSIWPRRTTTCRRATPDGCHVQTGKSKAKVCTYGDKDSSTKVLLFGDSHAASWLPALDALGKSQHWRILNLTKSALSHPHR